MYNWGQEVSGQLGRAGLRYWTEFTYVQLRARSQWSAGIEQVVSELIVHFSKSSRSHLFEKEIVKGQNMLDRSYTCTIEVRSQWSAGIEHGCCRIDCIYFQVFWKSFIWKGNRKKRCWKEVTHVKLKARSQWPAGTEQGCCRIDVSFSK